MQLAQHLSGTIPILDAGGCHQYNQYQPKCIVETEGTDRLSVMVEKQVESKWQMVPISSY